MTPVALRGVRVGHFAGPSPFCTTAAVPNVSFRQPPPDPRVTTSIAIPAAAEPHLANPDLNQSFTKGVFLGEIREDLPPVRSYPEQPDQQAKLLSQLRGLMQKSDDSNDFD